MKHCILFFFILNFCNLAIGQDSLTPALPDTLRFELTSHNNISITATLNEQDTVQLMFHTAANDLTLISEKAPELTSVQWDNSASGIQSWGGKSKARISYSNTLQMGAFTWDSIVIWENERSGPNTDGKFGPNLFENLAIEIDFENNLFILHKTLPNAISIYTKIPLVYENGFMFVEGNSKLAPHTYPNRFLIHTGYGGTILYDNAFADSHQLNQHIEIIDEQILKDSYGNSIITKKGLLPQFSIQDILFENIPVGFFEGTIKNQSMSVVGGNLIKRFNLIIAPNRDFIYLKKNSLFDQPY